jgi:hypothetical protein
MDSLDCLLEHANAEANSPTGSVRSLLGALPPQTLFATAAAALFYARARTGALPKSATHLSTARYSRRCAASVRKVPTATAAQWSR